jgi:hypothetical protein
VSFRSTLGRISITAESMDELRSELSSLGLEDEAIEVLLGSFTKRFGILTEVSRPEGSSLSIQSSVPELKGIVEFASDGSPHITYKGSKLTGPIAIGLLLYAKGSTPIPISDLRDLIQESYRSMPVQQVSANLAKMRPFIIKEGSKGSYSYRLSGAGRSWIETQVLPSLRKTES